MFADFSYQNYYSSAIQQTVSLLMKDTTFHLHLEHWESSLVLRIGEKMRLLNVCSINNNLYTAYRFGTDSCMDEQWFIDDDGGQQDNVTYPQKSLSTAK